MQFERKYYLTDDLDIGPELNGICNEKFARYEMNHEVEIAQTLSVSDKFTNFSLLNNISIYSTGWPNLNHQHSYLSFPIVNLYVCKVRCFLLFRLPNAKDNIVLRSLNFS